MPTIYTPQVASELIVFKGQPDFVPIVGTPLLWASNTTSDVLIDTTNNNYYVLLSGRWFSGTAMTGPWTFVPSNALPPGFAKIPASSLAGARAADRGRHARGAGRHHRELDSADGHRAAEERSEVHAELGRSAAVFADSGDVAFVHQQFVGADHPGVAQCVLRGDGRRLVHGRAADRTLVGRDVGADRNLFDSVRRHRSTT